MYSMYVIITRVNSITNSSFCKCSGDIHRCETNLEKEKACIQAKAWIQAVKYEMESREEVKSALGELGSATGGLQTVLHDLAAGIIVVCQQLFGLLPAVNPTLSQDGLWKSGEGQGALGECAVDEHCQLIGFIVLHFGVYVHRYFAVFMSCKILNCFWIN